VGVPPGVNLGTVAWGGAKQTTPIRLSSQILGEFQPSALQRVGLLALGFQTRDGFRRRPPAAAFSGLSRAGRLLSGGRPDSVAWGSPITVAGPRRILTGFPVMP